MFVYTTMSKPADPNDLPTLAGLVLTFVLTVLLSEATRYDAFKHFMNKYSYLCTWELFRFFLWFGWWVAPPAMIIKIISMFMK
jgi:hypothetical protein